jgi:hypothetical protein
LLQFDEVFFAAGRYLPQPVQLIIYSVANSTSLGHCNRRIIRHCGPYPVEDGRTGVKPVTQLLQPPCGQFRRSRPDPGDLFEPPRYLHQFPRIDFPHGNPADESFDITALPDMLSYR